MKNEEVNRIIAEYMGCYWNENDSEYNDSVTGAPIPYYPVSLDALVPVWEKLNDDHNIAPTLEFGRMEGHVVCFWTNHYDPAENTISTNFHKAAAYATAKAIKELK